MGSLQQEIDKAQSGFLLLVRLINIDELNLLINDVSSVVDKFYLMIDRACARAKHCKILKTSDLTTLHIIVEDNVKVAEKLAYAIFSQIQLYVDSELTESYLKCAVGSIKFSQDLSMCAKRLLAMVSYGMSTAKEGSYYYNYDDHPIDIEKLRERNTKLHLLRTSLFKKKVKFMYQPVIDRKSGNIEYYECLLRVRDNNNNSVSIGPLIEDAEVKGLISIVDFTVIEMAVNELVKDKKIKLSVNISNIGVLNRRLLRRIEHILKKFDVAKRLIIEITETSLNYDFKTTKKFIDTLHSYGCQIALDDFGSGFTSFKQLLNLPIDIIKIDGSYIRDILSNNHSKFFVEALINLAAELGIKTVAEFVESGEIAKFLIDTKIGGMQGNFFLPASDERLD